MKISVVSPFFEKGNPHQPIPSVSLYAEHLSQQLQKQHDITILTTFSDRASSQPQHSPSSKGTISIYHCFHRGIVGLFQLWNTIRRRHFDIVHIQHETFLYGNGETLVLFPLFVGLLRFCTIPVTTLHHVVSPAHINRTFAKMNHSAFPPFLIRFGYAVFYRLMGILGGPMIVHEEGFRNILTEHYGIPEEKITVIPHGIADPTLFTPKDQASLRAHFGIPRSARTIFGFFGYVSGYKGIDLLLSAFEEHVRQYPDDHLLISGAVHPGHSNNARYRHFLRATELHAHRISNVHWTGGVTDRDVGPFFSLIDCLVLPYRTCFGQSGPLSYAIGAGKPFLASEKLRPIVPYDVLLFSLTQQSLADKLAAFSRSSPEERIRLSSSCAHLRQERMWKKVGNATGTLYETLLARSKKSPRILLLGAYGQRNLGDDLLLAECLRLLPRNECCVASADPVRTERENGVCTIGSHRGWLRKIMAVLRAETIIIGGGDQLKLLTKCRDRHPFSLLLQCVIVALLATMCRKRLVFLGIGIGNIETRLARLLSAWILTMATVTTFRDRESALCATQLAPRARTLLAADLAFLSPSTHGAPGKNMRRLGIAPVMALDHPSILPLLKTYLSRAADGYLGDQPERSIAFLPFQTGWNAQHDIRMSADILARIEQKHRATIMQDLSVNTVETTYASLDALWGMRLHSLILATLYAVPFIALIYDVKVRNFLREIDYEGFGLPLDASFSTEKLLAMQRHLEDHAEEIRAHLRTQAEKLRARAGTNALILEAIREKGNRGLDDLLAANEDAVEQTSHQHSADIPLIPTHSRHSSHG